MWPAATVETDLQAGANHKYEVSDRLSLFVIFFFIIIRKSFNQVDWRRGTNPGLYTVVVDYFGWANFCAYNSVTGCKSWSDNR